MEETIKLKDLFISLKKRAGLVALTTIFAVLIAGVMSFYVLTPVYEASTQVLVNQSDSSSEESLYNNYEVQTNLQLMNTYFVIVQSPRILKQVIEEMDLPMTVDELNQSISVSSEEDSQVLNITVENEDPQMAVDIANTVASIFEENIVEIMNVNNVAILAEATLAENPAPIKPHTTLNMIIALFGGLIVGIGSALLLNYIDNTIKTEKDIEKHMGIPILGVIPQTGDK